ncbi:S8 family serine peptidase [Actinosynnema mirum]|uniref:Peptidase S8 and S53 subtilisin kexin sedolisin n=1 Tax=Actinosynnema mirum (strain ATCC 29888 / DSM 43827 / JCM 3225 / NBRC 14064 / NCIMB 13271 / NRRL B-12336 / IMRU 3971 / 101) TaxID=446462 RepID=C6WHD1_ACTMD|nr:S8 family serine peptidase [Actinosynnema mirum]ACU38050.1 peptidase S8 and S53 subtilisin kexin sedolisin [Actinosynnema mirum DSM 43827]
MPLRKALSAGVVAAVVAAALTATVPTAAAGPETGRDAPGAAGTGTASASTTGAATTDVSTTSASTTGAATTGGQRPRGVVTLLTGDVVAVGGDDVRVTPGAGREKIVFHRSGGPDVLRVIPSDVAADVASGRLDRALFDVAGLIAQGYDDARTDHLPLIVTGAPDAVRPAGDAVRELPSVDGYALDVPKSRPLLASAAEQVPGRIWLDAKARTTLDRTAAQIGAPAAWAAGLTGAGAKVAVLDTGVDAAHPDLAGAVVESANFSDSADAGDRDGHGTHVASTITGSGRYRGIAPDAVILNGKVLDDRGGGAYSWIIAGMEWAAPRADVVTMSLGAPASEDDPLTLALDRLTAETGALFVVAAGNSGPRASTVGSPGSAASALTVGAVDRDDVPAPFSSRGPGPDERVLKPDVTAPGVGVVAAEAGSPDGHVAMSGTSMAAPHVAGAAAILAQQHPDWLAPQLKAALMGTAVDPKGATVYEQGAGRVDLARATTTPLQADPPSLGLGTLRFPHDDGEQPSPRTVTYRNTGDQPEEVALTAVLRDPSGAEIPGAVSVSPSSVTVPAGGSAEVVVTTTLPAGSPIGAYSGVLLAGDAVRVPIGLTREGEMRDLPVRVLDHEGGPASMYTFWLLNTATGEEHRMFGPSGSTTVRLPVGDYLMHAVIVLGEKATTFVEPALRIDGSSVLELDARRGVPMRVAVDEPGAVPAAVGVALTMDVLGRPAHASSFSYAPETMLFVPSSTTSEAAKTTLEHALVPPEGFTGLPYQYALKWAVEGGVPHDLSREFRKRDLAHVNAAVASGGSGNVVQHDLLTTLATPHAILLHYSPDVPWRHRTDLWSEQGGSGKGTQEHVKDVVYRKGQVLSESWYRGVLGPAFPEIGEGDVPHASRRRDQFLYWVPLFTDQAANHKGGRDYSTEHVVLTRDGEVLLDELRRGQHLLARMPQDPGDYELSVDASSGVGFDLSTRVSAKWRFHSEQTQAEEAVPLLAVRFAPDLDQRNRAPRGRVTIPVSVQRNGSADVSDVRRPSVEVSYDDGRTWRAAPVSGRDGEWSVTTASPPGAVFASLRSSTSDSSGNSLVQTIIRAYALR